MAADEGQQRLAAACRRFLGLPLRSVGTVPEDANVSECTARGEPFVLTLVPACAAKRRAYQTEQRGASDKHPFVAAS